MKIGFFILITAVITITPAKAAHDTYTNGSLELGGTPNESDTHVNPKQDDTQLAATNSNPAAEEESLLPPGDKTQAAITYKKIQGQPVSMPSNLNDLPNVVGTDFIPNIKTTVYPMNNGNIFGTAIFNPSDLIRFTPLEMAEVNSVSGYRGAASLNGSNITGFDGKPQEFFIPNTTLQNNFHQAYPMDANNLITATNRRLTHTHDESCDHDASSPFPGDIIKQTPFREQDGYRPGCQALGVEGGPTRAHREQLKECLQSIKQAVAKVSRNNAQGLDRTKWMCHVMSLLNPLEQEFAGMIFTAGIEAGKVATNSHTSEPGWQETMFVQKVIQNRTRQLQKDKGRQYNALDVALSHMQFSMYNKNEFHKWRDHLEPKSNQGKAEFDKAIEGFIALNERPEMLQPRPQVDRMDSYFSPYGMLLPGGHKTADGRTRKDLIRDGLAPSDYPARNQNNRTLYVPNWDFRKFNRVKDLRLASKAHGDRPVRDYGCGGGGSGCPGYHIFYERKSGPMFYGGDIEGIIQRRNKCGGNNKIPKAAPVPVSAKPPAKTRNPHSD